MARKRRFIEHNALYMISFRTQTGLPFVPNALTNFLLKGIMAKAQELHDVTLCHYAWMANHPHLMIIAKDPEALPAFIGYIKAESAQMINALLGRRQRTLWTRGYHLLKVAGPEKAKQQISYLYNNPTEADLEETIEAYPGLTSWRQFHSEAHQEKVIKISRSSIPKLSSPQISISEAHRRVKLLESQNKYECTLTIKPNAWMKCFKETQSESVEKINRQIVSLIRENEKAYTKRRKDEDKEVIGATALQRQSILAEYESSKFSPGLLIIADDHAVIHDFLYRYFDLCEKAKKAYKKWEEGFFHFPMPPGMIPPKQPTRACYWQAYQH